MAFNVGDLVRLRSGGPAMTIWHVRHSPIPTAEPTVYDVEWFAGDEIRQHAFAEPELDANPPPCVYEIRSWDWSGPPKLFEYGKTWCRVHGFDCPNF